MVSKANKLGAFCDVGVFLSIISTIVALMTQNFAHAKNPELTLPHRFILALRQSAVSHNVRINRIDAEPPDKSAKTLIQASWRITATADSPAITRWTNAMLKDFPACGMRQVQLQRPNANVKEFEANLTWTCIEVISP
jgi:hypothetical protein